MPNGSDQKIAAVFLSLAKNPFGLFRQVLQSARYRRCVRQKMFRILFLLTQQTLRGVLIV